MNQQTARCDLRQAMPISRARAVFAAIVSVALMTGCATNAAEPEERPEVPEATSSSASGDSTGFQPNVVSGGEPEPNVVSYNEYRDPLMPVNRFIFGFNDIVSRYALVPLGKGYARIVPDPVDDRVEDFFYNVRAPIYAVNNLIQLKPADSGRNLLRFGINSTLGLLGLFDPAMDWFGIERQETDFSETLAHYGAGYGVYIVLPFLGPSDLRNTGGRVFDYFLHPIPYLLDNPESTALISYGYFHDFAQSAESYGKLFEEAEDPYLFMRNLHLQGIQRDAAYQ